MAAKPVAGAIDWPHMLATHDRWLRQVVRARLIDAHAVDDVMQELALALVSQRPPAGLELARVPAWLYRVTVRQALLYRRRTGRGRKLLASVAERQAGACSDPSPEPLTWLVAEERHQLVRQAVAQLPARDAEIILLRYVENLAPKAIAARLGLSVSAVDARLFRAREKLRSALANVVPGETANRPSEVTV